MVQLQVYSEIEQREIALRKAIREKLGRDFEDSELKHMDFKCFYYPESKVYQYMVDGECILQWKLP